MNWFNGRLNAIIGDITAFKADAIVNAANSSLLGGGGVDGAIHRIGGPSILDECRRIRETVLPNGLPTGQAVETRAGLLPCKYVIHTVGPVWTGGHSGEEKHLADAYRNSVKKAVELGAKSIAFPAISTGIYGYPPDKAARIAWSILADELKRNSLIEKITLVFFSKANLDTFLNAL